MTARLSTVVTLTLFALAAQPALAQITDRTWGGGSNGALDSGNHLWSVPGNWSGDNVPDTGFGSGERAVIGSTTGDRNITSPGTAATISQISWTQSGASSGVNKLTLDADLTINHNVGTSWQQSNATGDPARMVLDLNSHKFTVAPNASLNNLSILDSSGGGVFQSQLFQGGTGVIGPGVTVRQAASGQFQPGSVNFHPTSTSIIASGTGNTLQANGAAIGNFQIGEPSGATVTIFMLSHFTQTVQGNFTIHSNGSNDANLNIGTTNSNFAVAGNFIDNAPASATNYGGAGGGTIGFYGSPFPARTLSIARSLVNNFRVGDVGVDAGGLPANAPSNGSIQLANDLTTTGTFLVRGGSQLDVVDYSLTSGNFTGDNNAIFTYTAGADTGHIQVNGNLTLSNFTLNLYSSGGWTNGDDLILFSYTGTLGGAPSLTLGRVPGVFSYDSFVAAGGVVKLTNLMLPEPGAIGALLAAAASLLLRRRSGLHPSDQINR